MNWRMILRMIGLALLMEAGLMLLPFVAGLCYSERPLAFLVTAGLAGLTSETAHSASELILNRGNLLSVDI